VILLGEAVRRLCDYLPSHYDVNVQLLLEQSNQLWQTLQHIKPEQAETFFQQLQNPDDGDRDLTKGCQLPYIVTVN
jgi:hypothetical protein